MNKFESMLLLGPALGFILGIFFAWFITYSKVKLVEKEAAKKEKELKDKITELEPLSSELQKTSARLENSQASVDSLEKQLLEIATELKGEVQERSALTEQVKKIVILEGNIAELKKSEREAIEFQEKLSSSEAIIVEIRKSLEDKKSEIEDYKIRFDNLAEELDEATAKTTKFAVLQEKVKSLETSKIELIRENEQLRAMQDQLSQLDEIKQMYGKTLEENHLLRNQDLAKHFVQIKDGLEQSIKAYNKMLTMVDDPALTDNKVIEIEGNAISNDDILEVEDTSSEVSEEEILDKIQPDIENLKKFDGDKETSEA